MDEESLLIIISCLVGLSSFPGISELVLSDNVN